MLGNHLVTKQTGPEGAQVGKVMLAESIDLAKELYFAILFDRKHQGPVIVASPKGGMDIEQVAEEHPDQIFTEVIDFVKGPQPEQTKRIAEKLGFTGKDVALAQEQMSRLYTLFLKSDATMVEVNPFAVTPEGKSMYILPRLAFHCIFSESILIVVYCVDAKINFDDNAVFRQKDIFAYRDTTQEDPREVAAHKYELNYIGMDGNIGCMVNGAGLAMATMDIIKVLYNTITLVHYLFINFIIFYYSYYYIIIFLLFLYYNNSYYSSTMEAQQTSWMSEEAQTKSKSPKHSKFSTAILVCKQSL